MYSGRRNLWTVPKCSQNGANNRMGLRLVLPLPHATYRLGAAAAKSQARLQGGLATLPTHIWFGLLDATFWNQAEPSPEPS